MNPDYSTASLGAAIAAVLGTILFSAAVYVWISLATSRVFAKLGEPAWKGWVPVLNTVTLFRLGGFNPLWVIALFFPVVQIAGLVVFCFALHAITKRFGLGGGFTALAIVIYPVWASVIGFGRYQPVDATEPEARRAFEQRMTSLQSPFVPAPVPESAVPEPVEGPAATPLLSAIDPWAPPVATPVPVAAPFVPAPPPVAGPPVPEPVEGPAPALAPAPAVQFDADPTIVTSPPPPPVTAEDLDAEKTVISTRRRKTWILLPAGAEPIRITGDAVLLGRAPQATEGVDGAPTVVPDPGKTVSKTHARLAFDGDAWTITDLGSTNGVVLVDPTGVETELAPGIATALTETFRLGELSLTLLPES